MLNADTDAEIASAHYVALAQYWDSVSDVEWTLNRPAAIQQLREQVLRKKEILDQAAGIAGPGVGHGQAASGALALERAPDSQPHVPEWLK